MSPILGIYASQVSGKLWPASSYESIATTTVGAGGTSTITFSSIPSTYTHLQIRATLKSTSTAATGALICLIRFNSDTASNYSNHSLRVNGVTTPASPTVGATAATSQTSASSGPILVISSTVTNAFSVGIIDILDYASTNKNKTIRALTGGEVNTDGGWIGLYSGLWYKTPEAITSITFTPSSDNIAQYSSFALYGIKVAA
jgi:hypothetical protein